MSAVAYRGVQKPVIDLCRLIAKKSQLSDEDSDFIIQCESTERRHFTPSLIKLAYNEERQVTTQEKGPVIEVIGENQTGKTTYLLYLANLLGYDFSDQDNIEFISDENLVEQGEAVFKKLIDGMDATLEIISEKNKLFIEATKGTVNVTVINEQGKSTTPFQLSAQSRPFAEYLKPFVSVQLISKGRNFDRHLLMDICGDINDYVAIFEKRSQNLVALLRSKSDALRSTASLAQGVDLSERRDAIQTDLDGASDTKQSLNTSLTAVQMKIEVANRLTEELTALENLEAFKTYKDSYLLTNKLKTLEQRRQILQDNAKEQQKTTEKITALETELSELNAFIQKKKEILNNIITTTNSTVSAINGEIDNFQDQTHAHSVNGLLQSHEYEIIAKELQTVENDSGNAIVALYETAQKWNPSIKITQELGGTIGNLKSSLETAKNKILDNSLVKKITKDLFDTLKKSDVSSFEAFEKLRDEIEVLGGKAIFLKTSLDGVKATQTDLKHSDQATLLDKTKREIAETQAKMEEKEKQKKSIDEANAKRIEELVRMESSLNTQEAVQECGSEPLVFASNWEDKLITYVEKLRRNVQDLELKLNEQQAKIDELTKSKQTIDNILSSTEYASLSKRRDALDSFMGTMQTLKRVLNDSGTLIGERSENAELEYLTTHGIMEPLDTVINQIFREKCAQSFKMINETEFKAETITSFDYYNRTFTSNKHEQNIARLSGGTASVMTVLSIASKENESQFGSILLIDEFNDVASTLRNETYKRLIKNNQLSFSFFVTPVDKSPFKTRTAKIEE